MKIDLGYIVNMSKKQGAKTENIAFIYRVCLVFCLLLIGCLSLVLIHIYVIHYHSYGECPFLI